MTPGLEEKPRGSRMATTVALATVLEAKPQVGCPGPGLSTGDVGQSVDAGFCRRRMTPPLSPSPNIPF